MIKADKAKDWIRENIPMLMVLIENKYTGMAYDRFASLPGTQQRQVIMGATAAVTLMVVAHLLFSYFSLWSSNRQISQSYEMVTTIRKYQKQQRQQGSGLQQMEQNGALANQGRLKEHLMAQARASGISPRMIQADESGGADLAGGEAGSGEEEAPTGDLNMRRATVKLQRVNLTQLKTFLQAVEFGRYSLEVSSIKIRNDDQIRGYMDVDMGIVAYLFGTAGSTAAAPESGESM